MATVTDAGLTYFAKFLHDNESSAIINKIRIGSSSQPEAPDDTDLISKYTDLGFEEATASTIEFASGKLHLQKIFTNNSTADREVWECGAFTSAGDCICRHVWLPYEVANNNTVIPGQTITIDIYIELIPDDDITYTLTESGSPTTHEYLLEGKIVVSATVGDDPIDPSSYTCERGKICFNGIVLPNASPPLVTESRGGKTWVIKCATQDYTQVTRLVTKQGLVNVGVSVTGYQYATSLQRYGTLKIWDKALKTHISYNNCLLAGPVNVETFGLWYLFDLTIIQSYYGDL
jgi:hypothetical protein